MKTVTNEYVYQSLVHTHWYNTVILKVESGTAATEVLDLLRLSMGELHVRQTQTILG